uniref:Proline dehydrogenase n=1 Tax=Aceria tosichella TaxID=561515 RepID=A0A6G1SK58_9ACAR
MKTTNFVRQLQARASMARAASAPAPNPAEPFIGGHHHNNRSAAQASTSANRRHNQLRDQHDHQQEFLRARQFHQQLGLSSPLVGSQTGAGGLGEHHLDHEQHQYQLHDELVRQQQQHTDQQARQPPARDQLDLSFSNTKVVYKSKSMGQLLRNYFVLGLCKNDLLVRNNERLMKWSRRLLGKRLFEQIMRQTFYGQFVAGEDEQAIVPVIRHLSAFGVKTILDYSAEEDVAEEEVKEDVRADAERTKSESNYLADHSPLRRYQQSADFADRRKYLPVARTYFYHGESQCERNLEIFFKAIEAVANTTGNTGFAAIKLTALGRPRLLMKLSKIIDYMRAIEGGEPRAECLSELLERFNRLNQSDINTLDEDEEEMLFNLMRRVNRIAAYASQVGGARCMIDAEQTYMQPAINMIAMELMRQYNRREPIIFNTYQCYLKSAYDQLRKDLAMARRENFFFGAKLVRGAYMDQERARAAKLGYEDPINESFEATTRMYEKTLSYLMGEIERELKLAGMPTKVGPASGDEATQAVPDSPSSAPIKPAESAIDRALNASNSRRISIMVASHNEETVRFALEQMERRGIKPWHRLICFGQLYGMCDHVSFMLGQSGYSVYKYTPYGPVEEVLPYLGRRAIENHGFLSKLERERTLLAREILARLARMQLFYKPAGNYRPT